MNDLLRQYEPSECVYDSYSWEWAHAIYGGDEFGPRGVVALPIKDPGCRRSKHFTDDQGVGYCKRHADERGKVS